MKWPSIPQACLSCQSHRKHSLFPRTLFFDCKLCSNNILIVWKQFLLSLSYQQATNMFVQPCKERKRKQTRLCITKNLLKLSFPFSEVPLSIPTRPIINHDVLCLCHINPIKFPSVARCPKQDGRRYRSKMGAGRKHSPPPL